MSQNSKIQCIGCNALVPDIDGPTHKYLGASPGCWKIFGDVLAKEYGDLAYHKVHRLTVDAYAVQHIGEPSPQTIQSINVHLIALCAAIEHGVEFSFIPNVMNDRLKLYKGIFKWLDPPESLGDMTVVDVVDASSPEEHEQLIRKWAEDTWNAWRGYHELIESYYQDIP